MINVLEAAAIRTQEAAGRAWADLQACPRADMLSEMQANYDAAHAMEVAAYNAFKADNDARKAAA